MMRLHLGSRQAGGHAVIRESPMTMFICALLGAGLASFFIVRFAHLHLGMTADRPDEGPQKFHAQPVPRIGGLAVFLGLILAGTVGFLREFATTAFFGFMLAALLPAFLGGFVEDLTRRVGSTVRLLLTVVSAAVAFVWLDARLYRSDVDWLDAAFTLWPVSFALTLFAVAGLAHAMNLIDGYNGLSAGIGVIALGALGLVSREIGDYQIANLALAAAGAYVGFLLFNFPSGKLFQGDSGAYLLGTVLAILSAQLVGRHTGVSPWFPFALVVYPVWETLFSVMRRAIASAPLDAPDAQHLHSLIYQVAMPRLLPNRDSRSLELRNALTSVPLWAVQCAMAALAIAWYDSTQRLMLLCYGFVAFYCFIYVGIALLDRRRTERGQEPAASVGEVAESSRNS